MKIIDNKRKRNKGKLWGSLKLQRSYTLLQFMDIIYFDLT